jgi:hypothetical protein
MAFSSVSAKSTSNARFYRIRSVLGQFKGEVEKKGLVDHWRPDVSRHLG